MNKIKLDKKKTILLLLHFTAVYQFPSTKIPTVQNYAHLLLANAKNWTKISKENAVKTKRDKVTCKLENELVKKVDEL